MMFRHLREDALHLLGGGTTAFMRLGNHAEAEQAASYQAARLPGAHGWRPAATHRCSHRPR
jgi:hypothetical protein